MGSRRKRTEGRRFGGRKAVVLRRGGAQWGEEKRLGEKKSKVVRGREREGEKCCGVRRQEGRRRKDRFEKVKEEGRK